jgi:hypothetical protein
MAYGGGGAQPRATEHETTLRFLLHDLVGQEVSFYLLSAKQTIRGGLKSLAFNGVTQPHLSFFGLKE